MPSVSRKQQRAMFAAAAGHSNIGIPQKVGAEFARADIARAHGGHPGRMEKLKGKARTSAERKR